MQWAGLVGNPSLNISANQSYAVRLLAVCFFVAAIPSSYSLAPRRWVQESGVVIYALTMANQVVPVELLLVCDRVIQPSTAVFESV